MNWQGLQWPCSYSENHKGEMLGGSTEVRIEGENHNWNNIGIKHRTDVLFGLEQEHCYPIPVSCVSLHRRHDKVKNTYKRRNKQKGTPSTHHPFHWAVNLLMSYSLKCIFGYMGYDVVADAPKTNETSNLCKNVI